VLGEEDVAWQTADNRTDGIMPRHDATGSN
jgi:hypothetical protein